VIDVQFEVLGAPYSLLSVALPASSNLYTRRGTLIGLNGHLEDATSTLSLLSPLQNALRSIPFLYQKITSPTPLTALVSTNSANTTFGVLQLDGKADWTVCQRDALLAWTGYSLVIKPMVFSSRRTRWAASEIAGRGLVALVGKGQIYQVVLKPGESFIIHPSALLAYSALPPLLHRISSVSASLRFQIPNMLKPDLSVQLDKIEAWRKIKDTPLWKSLTKALWSVRTWSRRAIWGDRLFLRFQGPATILIQSRTRRLVDVVGKEDMGEFAALEEPGAAIGASKGVSANGLKAMGKLAVPVSSTSGTLKKAIVSGGKVEFQDSDFKEFTR
jgi:uncharacterized protein (AIM24 family)